jgi:hypothetical protein
MDILSIGGQWMEFIASQPAIFTLQHGAAQ